MSRNSWITKEAVKFGLSALAVIAAIVSAFIFQNQLTTMQDQLAVMKTDQRPWVGLDRFEPSAAANGQGFEFAAIVKNTGKTAATNVHGSFKTGFLATMCLPLCRRIGETNARSGYSSLDVRL